MARTLHDQYSVRRPDFIPEGSADEALNPHIGGVFHDFIPVGQNSIDIHGRTDDADPLPLSTEPIPPHAPEKVKK